MHICSDHFFFFFFNDTATTEIYTLSLHDALPICFAGPGTVQATPTEDATVTALNKEKLEQELQRSEEHTSELQSLAYLVCRLLLEKKKKHINTTKKDESQQDN